MSLETARDISITRIAMKAEMLDAETELELAYAWRDHRDEDREHDKDDQQLDQRKTCLSRPLCVTASRRL